MVYNTSGNSFPEHGDLVVMGSINIKLKVAEIMADVSEFETIGMFTCGPRGFMDEVIDAASKYDNIELENEHYHW